MDIDAPSSIVRPPCIELNDGVTVTKPNDEDQQITNSIKLEILNFYKVAFVASQKTYLFQTIGNGIQT